MKRMLFILTAMVSFCVQAQNTLVVGKDGITIENIGDYKVLNDTIIIDTNVTISIIKWGEGIKDKKQHVLRVVQGDGYDYTPYSPSGFIHGTGDDFLKKQNRCFDLGGDISNITQIYVDSTLIYIIIPSQSTKLDIHDNVMTLYKDSLVFRNGENTSSFRSKGSVSINTPVHIEWVSFQGDFDEKEHKLRLVQGDSVIFDSIIETEAKCNITFYPNKETTVFVDDLVICTIGSDKQQAISLVIIGAIVLIVGCFIFRKKIFACLKKIMKIEEGKQSGSHEEGCGFPSDGGDGQGSDGEGTDNPVDTKDGVDELGGETLIDIPEDATFDLIWEKLTGIQRENAIVQIFQDNIHKLDLEQLSCILSESQKSALKDKLSSEFNLCEAIQKLSVDDLIGNLSKGQIDGIERLYKQPEPQSVIVTEKVDVDKMSAADMFKAMSPAKQMEFAALLPQSRLILPEVLLKYVISQLRSNSKKHILDEFLKEQFSNYGVSKDVWKVVSNRLTGADDSTQEISLEITKAQLEKNDVVAWNCVAKVIANNLNKPITSFEQKVPEEWDDLLAYISALVAEKRTTQKTELAVPECNRPDSVKQTLKPDPVCNNSETEISNCDNSVLKEELESAKEKLVATQNALKTTRKELETSNGTLVATKKDLETIKDALSTTQKDLDMTKNTLSTTRKDLETTKGALATTQNKLGATKDTLATVQKDLETTKGNLEFTKGELLVSQGKLRKTEDDLKNTLEKLLNTENSLGRANMKISGLIQRWIESMTNLRSEYESIPKEILDKYEFMFTGSDDILQSMVEKIISDRRSNLKKFIDRVNAITIEENTFSSDIEVAIKEILLDDLGGQYPGWVDILMRLYAYTRVSFIREELKKIGLNIELVTTAAERTLLLMSRVGICIDIPELFVSVYDKNIYELEPIRNIDRIIPSVSEHAKTGIIADVYRVGYHVVNSGKRKKTIVSIY